MQPPPAHIDGLDALGHRLPEGGVIGLADMMVVLEHAVEGREGQQHAAMLAMILQTHIEHQTAFGGREDEMIRTAGRAFDREPVGLQKIIDGDLLFLLDFG